MPLSGLSTHRKAKAYCEEPLTPPHSCTLARLKVCERTRFLKTSWRTSSPLQTRSGESGIHAHLLQSCDGLIRRQTVLCFQLVDIAQVDAS